jgi:hypothetical protein
MVPLQILRIAALSAFLFTSASAHCETPKVRKEWRCLCREERAAWIKAVNVYLPPPSRLSNLLNFPTSVRCQLTPRPQFLYYSRPCNFVDSTRGPKQFPLGRWDVRHVHLPLTDAGRADFVYANMDLNVLVNADHFSYPPLFRVLTLTFYRFMARRSSCPGTGYTSRLSRTR